MPIVHYLDGGATTEWIREMLIIEHEPLGEYDPDYAGCLKPRTELIDKIDTRPALQRIIESERKVKHGDYSER